MIDEILRIKKRCDFGEEMGKTLNLTMGEVECIFTLADHRAISSKQLSSMLEVSPSRGSRIVAKLVDRGYIVTNVDPHDRRTVMLSLTEEGRRCHQELEQEKIICEQRLTSRLDAQQLRIVKDGLDILLKVM
jgi:DNA-binding MarR family transcriptional regulator